MKFLLDCVSCYRIVTAATDTPPSPSAPAAEGETRSLVAPPPPAPVQPTGSSGARLRRKRSSASEWRPSLFAISEDNVVAPVKKEKQRKAPVNERRCAASSVRVHSHGRGDLIGREPLPMIVPAFSPTPFMF